MVTTPRRCAWERSDRTPRNTLIGARFRCLGSDSGMPSLTCSSQRIAYPDARALDGRKSLGSCERLPRVAMTNPGSVWM